MSITVIVPHKNCSEKAFRLLDSIPSDVSVVIVDDNSNEDHFRRLNKGVFHNYKNVTIIKNTSSESNAGTARNLGIENCPKGTEWVIFADSDDKFLIDAFIRLQETLAEDKKSEIIFFDCIAEKDLDGSPSCRCDNYRKLILQWPETKSYITASWPVPWGKAIRYKVITDHRELRFGSRVAGNDIEFSARLAALKPKVAVFVEPVYICYESSSSLTATLTQRKALDRLKANINCNIIFFDNRIVKPHYNYCLKFFMVSLLLIIKEREFGVFWDFAVNFVKATRANKMGLWGDSE